MKLKQEINPINKQRRKRIPLLQKMYLSWQRKISISEDNEYPDFNIDD